MNRFPRIGERSFSIKAVNASIRICSGKVVNDAGAFDDRRLMPSQMDEIIRGLHARGCRIFNLSIGDRKARYAGGRVGMWTAILDELARELDILIVVAAGNYEHDPANGNPEDHLLGYPRYLLTPQSRLLEPAVGANVLSVGAIAHAAAVATQGPGDVSIRPIADVGEPAPFTRSSPGIHESLKPDLCDDGGNMLYDGLVQGLSRRSESEVLTMHPRYLERLFTTAFGTSYAAPLVSHKAALVLRVFQLPARICCGRFWRTRLVRPTRRCGGCMVSARLRYAIFASMGSRMQHKPRLPIRTESFFSRTMQLAWIASLSTKFLFQRRLQRRRANARFA